MKNRSRSLCSLAALAAIANCTVAAPNDSSAPVQQSTTPFCDGTCNVPQDCTNPGPCLTNTCTNNMCGTVPAAADTPCGAGLVCDGAGHCVACLAADDCPGTDTSCQTRTCTSNACGFSYAASGTITPSDVAGDCQDTECDGMGNVVNVTDNSDAPANTACATGACTNGVPSMNPLAAETPCGSGMVCDGAGNCVGCDVATDCPGSDTFCEARTCTNHSCGESFTASGTITPSDVAGDCQDTECNGAGSQVNVVDNSDVPVTSNQCLQAVCTSGAPSNPPKPTHTACSQSGGSWCDGAGNCVQCTLASDCASFVCTNHACQAATCADGVKNGNETDVDCGGGTCSACANGKACLVNSDCTSSNCASGTCQPVSSGAVLIAKETFSDYAIGSNLDGQSCSSGCSGWQTTSRTQGTVCDGTSNSLGNSGPTWVRADNGISSKIVADFASLPAGLTSVGHAVDVDDRLDQNRVYKALNTSAGSVLASLGMLGTQQDLAGNYFVEKGSWYYTFVSNELAADSSSNFCGGHWQRGMGKQSCLETTKTNEVLQWGTNNTLNNYGFMRTTQGVSSLGPSSWDGTVLMDSTPHEITYKMEFGVSDTQCSSPDSLNNTVTCPACPNGTLCNAAITVWIDATPDANGDPAQSPNVTRKVISNLTNVTGVVGGVDVLEIGCVGPNSNSKSNDMTISHVGIAADDPVTHHGGFKKSRLE